MAPPGGFLQEMQWTRGQVKSTLITVGHILIPMTVIFFGIQHFLHPTALPGVPLQKQMPAWIPGRVIIDYMTGTALLVAGGSILLNTENADRGSLCRRLDFADGSHHLWTHLDRSVITIRYRSQRGGDQLFCRHAALRRSPPGAGEHDATIRLTFTLIQLLKAPFNLEPEVEFCHDIFKVAS